MPEPTQFPGDSSGENVIQIRYTGDVQGLQEASRQAQALVRQQQQQIAQVSQEIKASTDSIQKAAGEAVSLLSTTLTALDRVSNLAKTSVEGVGAAFGKVRETIKSFAEDSEAAVRAFDSTANAVKNLTVTVGEAVIAQRTLMALGGAGRAAAGAYMAGQIGAVGAAGMLAGAVFNPVTVGVAGLTLGYQWAQGQRQEAAATAIQARLGIDTTDYAGALQGISQRFTQRLFEEENQRAGVGRGGLEDYFKGIAEVGYRGLARTSAWLYESVAAITPESQAKAKQDYLRQAEIARTFQPPISFLSPPSELDTRNTRFAADVSDYWDKTKEYVGNAVTNIGGGLLYRMGVQPTEWQRSPEDVAAEMQRPEGPRTRYIQLSGAGVPSWRVPAGAMTGEGGWWGSNLVSRYLQGQDANEARDVRTIESHPMYVQARLQTNLEEASATLQRASQLFAGARGRSAAEFAGEKFQDASDTRFEGQRSILDFQYKTRQDEINQLQVIIGGGKPSEAEMKKYGGLSQAVEAYNRMHLEQQQNRRTLGQLYSEDRWASVNAGVQIQGQALLQDDTLKALRYQVQGAQDLSLEGQLGVRSRLSTLQRTQGLRLAESELTQLTSQLNLERQESAGMGGATLTPGLADAVTTKRLMVGYLKEQVDLQTQVDKLGEKEQARQIQIQKAQEPINREIQAIQQKLSVTENVEEQIRAQYQLTELEAKKSFDSIVQYYRIVMKQTEEDAKQSAQAQIGGIVDTARTRADMQLERFQRGQQGRNLQFQVGLAGQELQDITRFMTTPEAQEAFGAMARERINQVFQSKGQQLDFDEQDELRTLTFGSQGYLDAQARYATRRDRMNIERGGALLQSLPRTLSPTEENTPAIYRMDWANRGPFRARIDMQAGSMRLPQTYMEGAQAESFVQRAQEQLGGVEWSNQAQENINAVLERARFLRKEMEAITGRSLTPGEQIPSALMSPMQRRQENMLYSRMSMEDQFSAFGLDDLKGTIPAILQAQDVERRFGILAAAREAPNRTRMAIARDRMVYGEQDGDFAGEVRGGVEVGAQSLNRALGTFGENTARVVQGIGGSMAQSFNAAFFDAITNKAKNLPEIFRQLGLSIVNQFTQAFANLTVRTLFGNLLGGGPSGSSFLGVPAGAAVGAGAAGFGGGQASGGSQASGSSREGLLQAMLNKLLGGGPQQSVAQMQPAGSGGYSIPTSSSWGVGMASTTNAAQTSITQDQLNTVLNEVNQKYGGAGFTGGADVFVPNYAIEMDTSGYADYIPGEAYMSTLVGQPGGGSGGGWGILDVISNNVSSFKDFFSGAFGSTAPGPISTMLAEWMVSSSAGYQAWGAASYSSAEAMAMYGTNASNIAGTASTISSTIGMVTGGLSFGMSIYSMLSARTPGQVTGMLPGALMSGVMFGYMAGGAIGAGLASAGMIAAPVMMESAGMMAATTGAMASTMEAGAMGGVIGIAVAIVVVLIIWAVGTIMAKKRQKKANEMRRKEVISQDYQYCGQNLFNAIKYMEADEIEALIAFIEGKAADIPAELTDLRKILTRPRGGGLIALYPGGDYNYWTAGKVPTREVILTECYKQRDELVSRGRHFGLVVTDMPTQGVTRQTIESIPFVQGEITLRQLANISQRKGVAEVFLAGLDDEIAERLLRRLQQTANRIDMPINRIFQYNLLNRY